jgi:histidine triad (HIT) family protein
MTNHTEIKKQLIEQVQKQNIPNKDQIITQIKTMSDSQFEQFLKQNNISPENNCIFCSIVDNQMPSVKIGENEDALAVLEINPISKGHSLIIPKEHIESADKIPPKATDLSKEISDKIKKIFQPKEVLIDINSVMNHIAINIIPVYDKETLNFSS